MKFMTPKQYAQLLFKVFFKSRSLSEETKEWSRKDIGTYVTYANIYTFFFLLLIMTLIELIAQIYGFHFYFIKAVMGIALGFVVSIIMSIIIKDYHLGVVFGIAISVVSGVVMGAELSVSEHLVFGIAIGIPFGFVTGIAATTTKMDVKWGIMWGIAAVISYGMSGGIVKGLTGFCFVIIAYFLTWSRWFYIPYLFIPFFKKITPQKLPIHWDENIGAPLPFLTTLLVHISTYNRQAAINETLFLIRERPPHRKAAQKALVKIAIEEMITFRDVQDIANLKNELNFLPQDPEFFPESYTKGYKDISLFARDARTALNESNHSNRLRVLERLAETITEFQKKMDFTQKDIGIPFGRIASRWLKIIGKEVNHIEADVGRPLANPFIVGRPIDAQSELFVGRWDIIEHIQHEALREGGAGAILFIGNRRSGKTSTLLNLKRYLLSSLKPVFIDCQQTVISSQVVYFTRAVSRSVQLALDGKKEVLKQADSLAELTELLQRIQAELQEKNQHLLLCFDEYERLTEKIVSSDFAGLPDAFRFWVQHLPRTICLFSGSHSLTEIEAIDWTDYLINVRTVHISFLDYESALRLVTEPIPNFNLLFEPDTETARQLVLRLGCQPFLLQATMSELVNYLNTLHRKTVTPTDIEIAIEKLFEFQNTYFEHIWKSETRNKEKEVLEAIIKEKRIPKELDVAVRSLIRKEVLRKKDDNFVFCVPVFQEWIAKTQI